MKRKNAQTSIEFVILVGFILFAFVVFFVIIQNNTSEKVDERRKLEFKEVGEKIKSEIDLAFHSTNGYYRNFDVPDIIFGVNYSLSIQENSLTIVSIEEDYSMSLSVREINGQIKKGDNLIRRINGTVYLN